VKAVAGTADWREGSFKESQSLQLQGRASNRQGSLYPLKAVRLVEMIPAIVKNYGNYRQAIQTHSNS
jgi:hypothetical protein